VPAFRYALRTVNRRHLRIAAVLLAVSLVLTLVAGVHYYVAQRLVLDPALPEPLRSLGLGLVALLGASLVLFPLAERTLRLSWLRWLAWPPMVWLGVLFFTLNLLLLSDAVLWLMGAAASPEQTLGGLRLRAFAVIGLTALATGVAMRSALAGPELRRVEVELERWPRGLDGFRIVQLSDVHIGPLLDRRFAAEVVERVARVAPDLVVITGDLVDGSVEHLGEEVAPFAGLNAPHGVWFVTGNHDHYSGADPWVARVAELGIEPLRNRRVRIGEGEASFDLAGVDDHRGDWVHGSPEDMEAALSGRDAERAVVLLAHDPSAFPRAVARDVDLQLSGHTHGGQIWPFRHLVRLVVPFVEGLHRRGRSQLYVSRGTGFWGPPLRLFAPAEITEITLRAKA